MEWLPADQYVFDPGEIAQLCAVNRRTVLRWIERRQLAAFRLAGTIRVPRPALLNLRDRAAIPDAEIFEAWAPPDQPLFSPSEIATLCAVNRHTVGRWIAQAHLNAQRLVNTVRIPRTELLRFLQAHYQPAVSDPDGAEPA